MRNVWGASGLAVVALVIAACGSSGSSAAQGSGAAGAATSSPASPSTGTALMTTTITGTKVLTNSQGFTLYWFAPDTGPTPKRPGTHRPYRPRWNGPPPAGASAPCRTHPDPRASGAP